MKDYNISADDLTKYYGMNLTNWMRLTGYNAKDVAQLLEVVPSTMSYIMTGDRRPGLDLIARTISVTGMTPGELFAAPDFISADDDPLESMRSMGETHAKLGAQIRNLYDRLRQS